jgi:diguanylate cyclase (GGDEF)-like protein
VGDLVAAPRQRVLLRALMAAMVAGLVLYALATLPAGRAATASAGIGVVWLKLGVQAVAAFLCLARARLVREDRAAWALVGLGLLLYDVGDGLWYLSVRHLDPPPFPSVADACWLGSYLFLYVAVVLLLRRRTLRFPASVWFDGVVGGLGAAALMAAVAFDTIASSADGGPAAVAVNLAYPFADLLLLAIVVGVFALFGWRAGRAWLLLGAGFVALAVADTVYLFQYANGTYLDGGPLDAVWALAIVLPGLAAWQQPQRERVPFLDHWAVLTVPTLFVVGALGLLIYAGFTRVSPVAVILATGTVFAAVGRIQFTFTELRDLTETRRLARTDDLTGLANRRRFLQQLDAALERRQDPEQVAVLILDLDRFKEVNDSLGHHWGDDLLRAVGERLAAEVPDVEVLARLGGDEFAVVLCGDASPAAGIAQRLRDRLRAAFVLGDVTLHVDASIGIAVCPDHGRTTSELLQCADVAMYRAKAGRTGVERYRPEQDGGGRDRLETIEALRSGLDDGQLLLHYQPKMALSSGEIVGVEALVRWAHPTRGLLYPDAFLPLAEQAGLMRRLTGHVLELALAQCRAWSERGLRLPVAVNLSASDLVDVQLPAQVRALLDRHGLPAHVLELEITESVLLRDRLRSAEILGALRALGVRIALDDYGTGYSSLAYLRELPVDELKLDRVFVRDMAVAPQAAAIVRSTVSLAHSLGLEMVAEGVESQDALEALADYGCDIAQGYLLGRPQPAEELSRWLLRRSLASASSDQMG